MLISLPQQHTFEALLYKICISHLPFCLHHSSVFRVFPTALEGIIMVATAVGLIMLLHIDFSNKWHLLPSCHIDCYKITKSIFDIRLHLPVGACIYFFNYLNSLQFCSVTFQVHVDSVLINAEHCHPVIIILGSCSTECAKIKLTRWERWIRHSKILFVVFRKNKH